MTLKGWTIEEVRQVMSMVDKGFTYSGIAEQLGRSRGAVAGLVWRQERHRKNGTVRPDVMIHRNIPMRFSELEKDFSI